MSSGYIEDITWVSRQQGDSPAITVCALNKEYTRGWKDEIEIKDIIKSTINLTKTKVVEKLKVLQKTTHSI